MLILFIPFLFLIFTFIFQPLLTLKLTPIEQIYRTRMVICKEPKKTPYAVAVVKTKLLISGGYT